jgi:hypothetical protein
MKKQHRWQATIATQVLDTSMYHVQVWLVIEPGFVCSHSCWETILVDHCIPHPTSQSDACCRLELFVQLGN